MKKYYAYHSLIMTIYAIVLLYCLLNNRFVPVLIAAILGMPLMILNYKKNHPASNRKVVK
ncbi:MULTISPECIES: hypothetical protein [Planococcus]|uniref:Uncharacterized protein n=1 Tax=Planococcus faecalis TaxID=1598147 RepID=A0ABM6IW13_9BACL|nr:MULTISPECIES: hypothetical protein [Planococcus]AQU80747.1 hypothetical protein AJGP001_16265 [Planococcus faecalis]MDJ0331963.1 hypothetical protein [Planococcus sp. S3-L1]OHX55738.1 hypothetical protein BB777_00840 [Planococcus faecalis]